MLVEVQGCEGRCDWSSEGEGVVGNELGLVVRIGLLAVVKSLDFILIFFLINLFIYLFILGCVGSSFLCEGFLQLLRAGATLHRSARASHCHGLSLRSLAPNAQAQ